MGLFKRSKPSQNSDNLSVHNGNTSKGLLSSMKRVNSNSSPSQNASIPDIPLPKAPDPNIDPAGYLRSIYAVRERSRLVLDKAKRNQLRHFNVDMSKFPETASYVVSIIKVGF